MSSHPPDLNMGWVEDRPAIEAFKASLPFQNLMAAAPAFADATMTDFFLFDSEAKYIATLREFGVDLPWETKVSGKTEYFLNLHQLTNDCTANGTAGAIQDRQMVRIVQSGVNEQWKLVATEPLYGGAIVTIMKTRGDNGAYTGAPVKYAMDYGFLERKVYGDIDLTKYSGARTTQWSKTGVPTSLLAEQAKHKIQTAVPITTYEEGCAFMQQGYSIIDGSSQGFSSTRDKDGFCRAQGTWQHCTRFRGKRVGKKPGWLYGQSWGAGMPGGPLTVTLDDGRDLDLPEGSFFVAPETVTAMLHQGGEFYALSDMNGFELLEYKFI